MLLPRRWVIWTATVAFGLLLYPLLTGARLFQSDRTNAAQDKPGSNGVVHPTPEERLALARTLPDCSIEALTPPPAWRWQSISPVAAQLPMPGEMSVQPDEVPDDPDIQQWAHARWGDIVLQLDAEAQQSPGFSIGSGAGTVDEPSCALRVGSGVVPVERSAFAVRRRGASGVDSMFSATTDIPIALPDTQLGVGITARTRAGRDTLLSILGALQLVGPEQGR